jgi:CRP-like cAMP-binding protein
MPSRTEYVALEQTTFVVLDDRFAAAARKWPGLHEVVGLQHARQARRASRHLATLGLSRVEDRVIALFCDLSDRWGRVTPLGIRIDVPLTHTVLGRLVGARRPTVTLALSALAADGLLRRDADGSWLLARDVPLAA